MLSDLSGKESDVDLAAGVARGLGSSMDSTFE